MKIKIPVPKKATAEPALDETLVEQQNSETLDEDQLGMIIDEAGRAQEDIVKLDLEIAKIMLKAQEKAKDFANKKLECSKKIENLRLVAQELEADADEEKIYAGNTFSVKVGVKGTTRAIKDIRGIADKLGEEAFWASATVNLSVVDQYISKKEQEDYIEITRGKRSIKILKK